MNLNEIDNRLSILEDYVEAQLSLHSLNEYATYIYKNKKIDIPKEVLESINKATKILFPKIDELQKSKQYKDLIKAAIEKDPNMINKKYGGSPTQKLYYKWQNSSGVYDYNEDNNTIEIKVNLDITPYWVTQELFYFEYNGYHLYNLTDDFYNKEIKGNKQITSLPYFDNTYNGDDFLGWTINFKIKIKK